MPERKRPSATANIALTPIEVSPSLKDRIYAQLREAITAPDIYSDNSNLRLDERELAARMNISRTPVREALARLEQEGLVRIVPRKGVFIALRTKAEILEMIQVWAALESMAARLATQHASNAEIASLRRLFVTFDEGDIRAHIDEYSDRNIEFHQAILELSKTRLLRDMAESLFVHMRAIRARTISEGERAERSIVDHLHIIEALEARDADVAERLVREHTLNLHVHVERTWIERTDDTESAA